MKCMRCLLTKNWCIQELEGFVPDISYDEYKSMTDKQHLNKSKSMPIRFLEASGKGFFIEKENYAIAIREDLEEIINLLKII